MSNVKFLDGIDIEADEYIWWFHDEVPSQPQFKEFLENHSNHVIYTRFGYIDEPILGRFRNQGTWKPLYPYVSKYFPMFKNRKLILFACNHDVGLKKITGEAMKQFHGMLLYMSLKNGNDVSQMVNMDRLYIMQNCDGGVRYPGFVPDVFGSIPQNIVRIYTKALGVMDDPVFRPLPNGMNWREAPQRVQTIKRLTASKKKHTNLLYVNMDPDMHVERPMLIDMLKDQDWVTMGQGVGDTFLEEIYHHTFCLAPRGNCADSHRTWESLYLGTIPVVLKTDAMSWFSDLPILQVDRWEDLTEAYLKQSYERICNSYYDMEKIKLSYWLNIVDDDYTENIEPIAQGSVMNVR